MRRCSTIITAIRELVAQVGEAEAARQSGMSIDDAVAIVSESEMVQG